VLVLDYDDVCGCVVEEERCVGHGHIFFCPEEDEMFPPVLLHQHQCMPRAEEPENWPERLNGGAWGVGGHATLSQANGDYVPKLFR